MCRNAVNIVYICDNTRQGKQALQIKVPDILKLVIETLTIKELHKKKYYAVIPKTHIKKNTEH